MKDCAVELRSALVALVLASGAAACGDARHEESGDARPPDAEATVAGDSLAPMARVEGPSESRGEHARFEGDGEHGEEGEEESGVLLGAGETWDATRDGVRLMLSFEPASNTFKGMVENTTSGMLCEVRVEVHLSNGTELGPTELADLPAGATGAVELPAGVEAFEKWTAHPEISPCPGT